MRFWLSAVRVICLLCAVLSPLGTAAFVPSNGTYYGLFFQTNTFWQQSSGTMKITTSSRGTYSANLRISTACYSFSGQLSTDGSVSVQILRYYQYPLTVNFQVTAEDPDVILGTIGNGVWTAVLNADRAVFNSTTNPCPFAGKYTMVLHGDFSSTQVPGGATVGTININTAGKINLNAYLADANKFTQSTFVSKRGRWPLYYPMYSGGGTFYGSILFNATTNEVISGDITWVKPASPCFYYYPYGFYVVNPVYGSTYVQPPKGMSVLNFTDGTIQFNGQSLYQGITNQVTLTSNNQLQNHSANGLSFGVNLSTGYFSGSVMDTVTWVWHPYKGVVVQNADIGTGYFTAGYLSGEVWLQGN
jgi:hypothetical protein